ncbi:hypothetical protein SDJN02_19934, partial [Cucurbita argyrosperma subsp. argyrosperma]
MAIFLKFLTPLLFLSLLWTGNCQCESNNIQINQRRTGFQIYGMTQWKVTISNNCICSQSNVKLDCRGFQIFESIDPSILAIFDTECLVNDGRPIFNFNPINYTYARDPKFKFDLISSQVACS